MLKTYTKSISSIVTFTCSLKNVICLFKFVQFVCLQSLQRQSYFDAENLRKVHDGNVLKKTIKNLFIMSGTLQFTIYKCLNNTLKSGESDFLTKRSTQIVKFVYKCIHAGANVLESTQMCLCLPVVYLNAYQIKFDKQSTNSARFKQTHMKLPRNTQFKQVPSIQQRTTTKQ